MAISKVILNGETQMDVTPDTVTPEVMVEGYTALKNNGVRAVGTFIPNEGTVTEVATGTGLTGGPITSSGTIKADLVSETKLSNAATAATETSGRVYPVAVDKNGKLAVNVPWENSTYTPASATPLVDGTAAVGSSAKYAREDHVHPSDTSRVPTSRTVNGKALSSNISLTASDVSAIATSAKGAAGGVAELDSNGLVPTSQLPSFVDDVLEYLSKSSFPATGETGKIYVDTTTNLTYRWSGSAYVEISPSLALGTTSSTAFRGDYGNAAYAHAVTNKGSAFSSGLYKITTNSEGHVTAATAVAKSDITALGIPGSDTNTWNAMTGATSSANGTVGYVNAVPPKDGYNTKYLRADGTWSVPPDNNTWTAMTGATSSANGTVGYVNAVPPKDGYNTKYLRADGTWSVPPDNNTKYGLSISGHTVSIVEGGSTSSVTVPDNNTTYGLSISGHTVSLVEGGTTASVTVPDNNDNNAVTQTATSTSANYEVLFSATADNTTRTEGARKNNNLTFNPNTGNLQVTQINGVTVGSSPKFTDTDTNTKYGLSISGHTVSLVEGGTTASVTVPDNDTNNAVTQTATTTNAAYEVLFSATADNTTRTEGARKNSNMTFNPSTGNLAVTQINGVTVGSSPKFTDNNTTYGLSISGHTVSLVEGGTTASVTVPDNNDNNAVTQTATTTSANYEVLFSATADNTTRTEGARKNSNMTFNPNTGNLQVTQINGVTVGSSPKFTDNNTTYGLSISGHTVSLVAGGTTSSVTVPDDDTTYESKTAASGGTDVSLVTTGEKYTWNNKLSSHQTIKQDGVTGATVNRYGACTTEAATAAKTVSVTTGTFNLEAGARVSVKFNNANTANSPTLNVNSKGAKNIFHKGAQITSGGNKALLAGICDFIYDGTQWHLVGNYIDTDNNTTYGLSISGHTVSLVSGGTTSSVTVPDNNTTYGLSISGHTVSLVEGGTTASVTVPDNNTTYTANTTSIGSASGWSAGTAASASVANGVLTITNGTKPALTVTATTVATGITAS